MEQSATPARTTGPLRIQRLQHCYHHLCESGPVTRTQMLRASYATPPDIMPKQLLAVARLQPDLYDTVSLNDFVHTMHQVLPESEPEFTNVVHAFANAMTIDAMAASTTREGPDSREPPAEQLRPQQVAPHYESEHRGSGGSTHYMPPQMLDAVVDAVRGTLERSWDAHRASWEPYPALSDVASGLDRVLERIPDLAVDVPDAPRLYAQLLYQVFEESWVPSDYLAEFLNRKAQHQPVDPAEQAVFKHLETILIKKKGHSV